MTPPQRSRRFRTSWLTDKMVPILLIVLGLALIAMLAIVVLAVIGVTPGG